MEKININLLQELLSSIDNWLLSVFFFIHTSTQTFPLSDWMRTCWAAIGHLYTFSNRKTCQLFWEHQISNQNVSGIILYITASTASLKPWFTSSYMLLGPFQFQIKSMAFRPNLTATPLQYAAVCVPLGNVRGIFSWFTPTGLVVTCRLLLKRVKKRNPLKTSQW